MHLPFANTILALFGVFVMFVGLAIHPNVFIIGSGLLLSLIAVLFQFEKRGTRRRR